jgi:ABC-type branched-subunit amino acid transport system substrate-binding protein
VEYLLSEDGGGAKRFFLLGTDYVYPRTTNKILRAFLHAKGIQDKDIEEVYTPFGYSDYQTIVANIKKFSAGGKTAVVSTINGDSNVPFYKELANQGLKATDVPVVAFSVGKRSCAASIPNRWSATSRHGTTLSPSITRPTKPLSPIIALTPKRTSCRMPIPW